jgi:hypothetical protein
MGHTVITAADVGRAGLAIPDDEVARYATAEGLAILTLNRRDFIRLHRADPNHAGMVVCTMDPDFAALSQRVHAAVSEHASLAGQLTRVNRPQV